MNPVRGAYELLHYPSSPRAATAPERLAAVATLFGLAAPGPETARVLEVGCSDGGNLLALAVTAPRGQFLGIDFSEPSVARGRERIREAGLGNIELKALDLAEFPADAGSFDYIIAHGVYSWVPETTRRQLLALIQRHLAPEGVAYVDYNAQPGSQVRYAFRESLRYHVQRFAEPQQKINQARSFLKLIADASPQGSLQRLLAEAELNRLVRTPDAALFHDTLASENHAFFFHEFAAAAAQHGLGYLAEADVCEMNDAPLSAAVRERLAGLRNLIEKEQYVDILRNRVFRQTLLCRAGRSISRNLDGSSLRALYFSASAQPSPGAGEGEVIYRHAFGALATANATMKAVIDLLTAVFPAQLGVPEIEAELRRRQPSLAQGPAGELTIALLHATMSGTVGIHATPGGFTTRVSARPMASALARAQAARGEDLFTLHLQTLQNPGEAPRALLPLLDGTRDTAELAQVLGWQSVEVEGTLHATAKNALLLRTDET